jgi:TolB protein
MRTHSRRSFLAMGAAMLAAAAGCAPTAATVPAVPAALQAREEIPGRMVYVRDGNLWLYQNGDARQLTSGGTWFQPAFSPDGQEIAYVFWENNFSDIFVMAWDGRSSRRLTRGQAASIMNNDWSFRPTWSPDGSQIAYISDAASYFPLVWVMDKDGGSRRQVLTAATGIESADALSWAPDGKRIAVTGLMQGLQSQIYVLDVPRGTVEKLTSHPNGSFDPAWSPDGQAVAYIGREGAQGELFVKRVDGEGEPARLGKLAYVRSPQWSPDGKSLAVLAAQGGTFQVWLIPVRGSGETIELGEPRQLTRDGTIDAASGLSWSK